MDGHSPPPFGSSTFEAARQREAVSLKTLGVIEIPNEASSVTVLHSIPKPAPSLLLTPAATASN